jgi:5'-nucleotidase (lipoprotein e(P4) family)
MKHLLASFILFFIFSACSFQSPKEALKKPENIRTYSIQSMMWQQNAAEYKALCHQAYHLAKLCLMASCNADQGLLPRAIITDIDETVLDNSPFNVKLLQKNENYTDKEWNKWVLQSNAKAIPGAIDFFNFAAEKGIEIFYVSNRAHSQATATIANLKKCHFPYADAAHVRLETNTSDKQNRFDEIRKKYKVLLYVGDNLSDFDSGFRATSTQARNQLESNLRNTFGTHFIVLPNPMYGDWESKGIYKGKRDWSQKQIDSLNKACLSTY